MLEKSSDAGRAERPKARASCVSWVERLGVDAVVVDGGADDLCCHVASLRQRVERGDDDVRRVHLELTAQRRVGDPVCAAALTVAAIAGLGALAGRVYTGAVLHTGATVKLRDAWRRSTSAQRPAGDRRRATRLS